MRKILTIAGSDSSGGAGIQADIKTITAFKMYAASAITSLTAQNTKGVFDVLDVEPKFLTAQIDAICDDIMPDAVKIGMLSNHKIMQAVANSIKKWNLQNVVLDPVMVATSGGVLMKEEAISVLKNELLPLAKLITPNIFEAQILSQTKISNLDDMRKSAIKIAEICKTSVLIKGGHLQDMAIDLLYENGEFYEFTNLKISTKNTHGTGCTLSSAIACCVANNLELKQAVKIAKDFVFKALSWQTQIGHGNGAIDHYFNIPPILD